MKSPFLKLAHSRWIKMINSLDKEILGRGNIESYKFIVSNSNYSFNIQKNTTTKIHLFLDVLNESKLVFNIFENSNVELILISTGSCSYEVEINIERDSNLKLYTADSFNTDVSITKSVNLKGINASVYAYEYIPSNDSNITGAFKLNHLYQDTKSEGIFNYLANGTGTINRDTISTMEENTFNANSSENIKGLILSETSRIDAKPILIIKCDDVHASHGCAIGTINANEIYYLMSRGLTYNDALKIICKSLINPILREITDDDFLSITKPILDKTIGE